MMKNLLEDDWCVSNVGISYKPVELQIWAGTKCSCLKNIIMRLLHERFPDTFE